MVNYETRFCAFVDILGFRSLIAGIADDVHGIADLNDALSVISDTPIFLNNPSLRGVVRPVLESNSESPIDHFIPDKSSSNVRGTSFSDSLVLTAPADFGGASNLLVALILLTHRLLDMAYLVRGGVAVGQVWHKKNLVFGPGLINAYDLEVGTAVYPRIVFSDSACDCFAKIEPVKGAITKFLTGDFDGVRFLDFLESPALWIASHEDSTEQYEWAGERLQRIGPRLSRIRDTVCGLAEANTAENLRTVAKYRWIATYLNRRLSDKEGLLIQDVPLPGGSP